MIRNKYSNNTPERLYGHRLVPSTLIRWCRVYPEMPFPGVVRLGPQLAVLWRLTGAGGHSGSRGSTDSDAPYGHSGRGQREEDSLARAGHNRDDLLLFIMHEAFRNASGKVHVMGYATGIGHVWR